jgi:hypothetical protein
MADMEKLKELYADPRHGILSEVLRVLDSSRVWGGMGWTHQPLAPFKYLPLREKVSDELMKIAKEHGIYE